MMKKLGIIPIPARLPMWILLALLSVGFLHSNTPSARAGSLPTGEVTTGPTMGGPDEPDDKTPRNATQPSTPNLTATQVPAAPSHPANQGFDFARWWAELLLVLRSAFQGMFPLR